MQNMERLVVKRDCEAIRIPDGSNALIRAGTEVILTQALGGSFTVRKADGLFRVGLSEADALGLEAKPQDQSTAQGPVSLEELERLAWASLKECYDPEIPVNIVDLGLVYDLHFEEDDAGRRKAFMKMTLTAPGCGMGRVIAGDAQMKLLAIPGIDDAEVEIVWDPPWHQSMITAEGRQVLGL